MLKILYACFKAIWRRWFGGGFDSLPNNRFFQHLIGFIVTFLMLHYLNYNIICNILACFALQGVFWALGHGPAFDFGRSKKIEVERYEKYFWDKWCKWLVPEKEWYQFGYDFLWMLFRYSLPALLVSVILCNWWFMMAGVCVTFAYTICWALYDKGKLKRLSATELAEIVSGFIVGLLLTM